MADRHIAQGEDHVIRQEAVLTILRARGRPTEAAELLLRTLNETLIEHRKHRDAIAAALEAGE